MARILQKYYLIHLIALLCIPLQSQAKTYENGYAANSVLSEGVWSKISVPATGFYKLTYDDLKKMGLNNPANAKIYGYGGWMLNEDFSKPYVDDLPEVSIWMSNSVADFGKNDYILFYARGDVKWEYNQTTGEFEQTQNPYSFDSYYFVTESEKEPNLVKSLQAQTAGATTITTFDDYYLHEQELVNIGQTGREFYGESFSANKSQNFTLLTEGATADPAIIHYNFIAKAAITSGQLSISLNGEPIKTDPVPPPALSLQEETLAVALNSTVTTTSLSNSNTLNLTYKVGTTADTRMYLNYLRVNYKKALKPYGAVTLFRSKLLEDNLNFQIAGANNSLLVFDVTGNTTIYKVNAQLSGTTMNFSASNSSLREYAMVDIARSKDIPTPTVVGKIDNQDLHAKQSAEMVIIVPPLLKEQAERLAELHKQNSGLTSLVVSSQDIYNEFSSGKPDVTAYRRFMKMLYDKGTSEKDRPKYLLLFGGGTYDNRFTRKEWTDTEKGSMLLTYQTRESLIETLSFVTDDYIGFLEDSEGSNLATATLDVGIGRLPVRSVTEAKNVVDKIGYYMSDTNKGVWQNDITFVADDFIKSTNTGPTTGERNFQNDAEKFGTAIATKYPDFVISKIYEDAYQRVVEANGGRYPDATKALLDKINRGTLVLNFSGHGSTRNWTHENLLTYSNIEGLSNAKLPLWITLTCDFSRFDYNERSGGELALLKSTGGAIGLISTVRVVYINKNSTMNEKINNHLLERENGKSLPLGDIVRKAKLEMGSDDNKLRFIYLGDPALRLAFADDTYKVEVSEVNGLDASAGGINLKALDDVVITGQVVNQAGDVASDYNGILESVVLDAKQYLKTRGNNSDGSVNEDYVTEFEDYTNTLFLGRVEVKNGLFEINFTVPKDIIYSGNQGKMNFLAYDTNGNNKAQGSFYNYTVGGTNPDAEDDDTPPVIEHMYLNNENFVSGGNVNSTPTFYAVVSDDTGINLSSGIGHNIILTIDGKTKYDLTPYFTNEGGSSKRGIVQYPIPQLSMGYHYLELRVWDVWNNSVTSDPPLEFVVTDELSAGDYDFVIWGNPARDLTKFVFTTNTPSTDVTVKISVYSLTGCMVWVHEERGSVDSLNRFTYDWNLHGNGGRLVPGVYVCSAEITVNGETKSLKAQKLMVVSN